MHELLKLVTTMTMKSSVRRAPSFFWAPWRPPELTPTASCAGHFLSAELRSVPMFRGPIKNQRRAEPLWQLGLCPFICWAGLQATRGSQRLSITASLGSGAGERFVLLGRSTNKSWI